MKIYFKIVVMIMMMVFIAGCSGGDVVSQKDQSDLKKLNSSVKNMEKLCKAGAGYACTFLSEFYHKKNDLRYQKIVFQYALRGCDLYNGHGCSFLAYLYQMGKGFPKDLQKTRYYSEKSCVLKSGEGCYNLALIYRNSDRNLERSISYFKRSCELKDGGGCFNLGVLYEDGKKIKEAKLFYKKACDLKNYRGCTNLGVILAHEKDGFFEAEQLYRRGCMLGDGKTCGFIGRIYEIGKGVKPNIEIANQFYRKGCALNDGRSCRMLGDSYYYGNGVSEDSEKATKYYQKGCKLGIREVCP